VKFADEIMEKQVRRFISNSIPYREMALTNKMDDIDVNSIAELGIGCMDSITNASGIESFKGLAHLWFGVNRLTNLDLSANTKLTQLSAGAQLPYLKCT
jgi:hypothetical protein